MAAASSSTTSSSSSGRTEALIVGIDFGTTFSGVAWASTSQPNKINSIRSWPNAAGVVQDKVKTELAYEEGRDEQAKKYKWGSQVGEDDKPLRWFKLLLHNQGYGTTFRFDRATPGTTSRLSRLEALMATKPKDKTPVDLVTDYLTALHKYFVKQLKREFPSTMVDGLGNETPVNYYLTVPAMWTPEAKRWTREAAQAAGIGSLGTLRLISEPEAAAAHCFIRYKETPHALKENDVYVIADCGGGTVDLISYKVIQVNPTLQVEEAAVGTGGLCGSVYINDRLEKLVRDRVGQSAFSKMSSKAKETMRQGIESVKLRFHASVKTNRAEGSEASNGSDSDDDDDQDEYAIPLKGVPENLRANIRSENVRLTKEEVIQVFEPIVEEITHMVQDQITETEQNIKKPITGVILVGGFGCSEYLREYLKANLTSSGSRDVTVLKAPDAWQAIAQGAVQHGLLMHDIGGGPVETDAPEATRSALISSRRLTASYGVCAHEPVCDCFSCTQNDKYPKDKIIFSPQLGQLICLDRMQWLVKKGQLISDKKPYEVSLMRLSPNSLFGRSDNTESTQTIYYSEDDKAPADKEDSSVLELLDYKQDFSRIDLKQHILKRPHPIFHGLSLEYLPCKTFMKTTESAEVVFWSEVNGIRVGSSEKVKPKILEE